MTPSKIWANFAVSDLDRTTKFYTALGFTPNGASKDLTSFLFSDGKFIIHFFLKEVIQANLDIPMADGHTASEIVFTLYAETKAEVDDWAKEVEPAGGKIISPPTAFGPGYYGFLFADPDGHKFNIFHM